MTDLADKRRANGLMKTALAQAAALRKAGGYTALERAARQTVFVEEYARLTPRYYPPAEVALVVTRYLDKWAELTAVTEAD
jgi:hypothetical protein